MQHHGYLDMLNKSDIYSMNPVVRVIRVLPILGYVIVKTVCLKGIKDTVLPFAPLRHEP